MIFTPFPVRRFVGLYNYIYEPDTNTHFIHNSKSLSLSINPSTETYSFEILMPLMSLKLPEITTFIPTCHHISTRADRERCDPTRVVTNSVAAPRSQPREVISCVDLGQQLLEFI